MTRPSALTLATAGELEDHRRAPASSANPVAVYCCCAPTGNRGAQRSDGRLLDTIRFERQRAPMADLRRSRRRSARSPRGTAPRRGRGTRLRRATSPREPAPRLTAHRTDRPQPEDDSRRHSPLEVVLYVESTWRVYSHYFRANRCAVSSRAWPAFSSRCRSARSAQEVQAGPREQGVHVTALWSPNCGAGGPRPTCAHPTRYFARSGAAVAVAPGSRQLPLGLAHRGADATREHVPHPRLARRRHTRREPVERQLRVARAWCARSFADGVLQVARRARRGTSSSSGATADGAGPGAIQSIHSRRKEPGRSCVGRRVGVCCRPGGLLLAD